MKSRIKLFTCLGVLLPALAGGAAAPQKELAQVLAARPDPEHGAQLFQQCIACHGPNGAGAIEGTTPRIAGQHYRVLARQIVDFRHGKRWDFLMEKIAVGHSLTTAQDVADVAMYVISLDWRGARGLGNGQQLQLGATIYEERCQSCHGRDASGDDPQGIPRLGGQHSAYLVRQIYDAVDGRRPLLTRSHKQRFESLDFEAILALTDYLARIEAPPDIASP